MESSGRSIIYYARLSLICISIVSNALFAGGIFIFPLLSPALASHLKLTQPQLTTIVLAGMIGQYPLAAFVGKIIDIYGPWFCSLVASVLFSFGFGFFSLEIAKTPDDISQPSATSFHNLTFFFFMAGLGTVFSLFSSLFSASKTFPKYLGIASSASMAIFGLSPLFLSLIASSNFFTDPDTGLNVTHFLRFHAIISGCIHLIGAVFLKLPPTPDVDLQRFLTDDPQRDTDLEPDERTVLLPGKPPNEIGTQVVAMDGEGQSALDLARDPHFWILFVVSLIILGCCEMVLSNIGTIVLSFPSTSTDSDSKSIILAPRNDRTTSSQVQMLSLANTISRLLAGPIADFVSPIASYLPNGERCFPRKHLISRMAFLVGACFILALTCFWMEVGVRSQAGVWVLSIGTGITYGTTFTLLPSIVSSVWGLQNLGRNFGIITYAPFIGTPLFSYLYAFVSASQTTNDGPVCEGVVCWQFTFWVGFAGAVLALCLNGMLWKSWRGKV